MPRLLRAAPGLVGLLVALLAASALAQGSQTSPFDPEDLARAAEAAGRPGLEVVFDLGAAMPLGNLGASFPHTDAGLGAEPGYRLGLRLRGLLDSGWTIAPTFTFTEFGDHDGVDDRTGKTGGQGQKYTVKASSLRYGLDVGYLSPGDPDAWRGFAAVGAAIVNNRYKEELLDDEVDYADSIYDFSWMVSVGVRRKGVELALEYHASSFETSRFLLLPGEYTWNYAAVRLGYALPRF
ncbi:hypothetical protein GF314_02110 [bacterium]|nr:hypothetical protein [bacterium]